MVIGEKVDHIKRDIEYAAAANSERRGENRRGARCIFEEEKGDRRDDSDPLHSIR